MKGHMIPQAASISTNILYSIPSNVDVDIFNYFVLLNFQWEVKIS
jgi:hypothetical protein